MGEEQEDILNRILDNIDSDVIKYSNDEIPINQGEVPNYEDFIEFLFSQNNEFYHWGDDVYYMLLTSNLKPEVIDSFPDLLKISRETLLLHFDYKNIGIALKHIINGEKEYINYYLKENEKINKVPPVMIKISYDFFLLSGISPDKLLDYDPKIRLLLSGMNKYNFNNRVLLLGIVVNPKIKTLSDSYDYVLVNFKSYMVMANSLLNNEKIRELKEEYKDEKEARINLNYNTDYDIINFYEIKEWSSRKNLIEEALKKIKYKASSTKRRVKFNINK